MHIVAFHNWHNFRPRYVVRRCHRSTVAGISVSRETQERPIGNFIHMSIWRHIAFSWMAIGWLESVDEIMGRPHHEAWSWAYALPIFNSIARRVHRLCLYVIIKNTGVPNPDLASKLLRVMAIDRCFTRPMAEEPDYKAQVWFWRMPGSSFGNRLSIWSCLLRLEQIGALSEYSQIHLLKTI